MIFDEFSLGLIEVLDALQDIIVRYHKEVFVIILEGVDKLECLRA